MAGILGFKSMEECDVTGKNVLIRVDINSPIDPESGKIVNTNRIDKTVPTIQWLLENGAKLAIIAHQGDSLDYRNLIPIEEHAFLLSRKTGRSIAYDVCGPAAVEKITSLKSGNAVIPGNLRYLCEEISTFENSVKLEPAQMTDTWLVRTLSPPF